ncbi:MAG: UDP-N-acetylglucosamine--N-acetylmuramyl-(pentapeptide) pyrophosphoryl-undecaprenol N-acetylglucosamine transferase [Rikenellaceae bacterium]
MMKNKHRIILSGGGTAGHIYPAVAVAEALAERYGKDNIEILFVGARGKMEMTKVAALGYNIVGLPIVGLRRSLSPQNLLLPFRLLRSYLMAYSILKKFRPEAVVGFGGYASVPILKCAQTLNIRTMLWEGNSYGGVANRLLGKKAEAIFVSYDNMDRFFDKEKLVRSGNPLRGDIFNKSVDKNAAYTYFGFTGERPILMVTGGSLGSRILNESVMAFLEEVIAEKKIDLIWQVGSYYEKEIKERVAQYDGKMSNVWLGAFINKMDFAYAIADVVVGRGGASTISELALLGKSAIIVPSSNVAEDHQTKNAMSLKNVGAVEMISDADAPTKLIPTAIELIFDTEKLKSLRENIKQFAVADSAEIIVNTINLK